MRALMVYESLWGNTEQLARAIADAVAEQFSIDVADSDAAPASVEAYDLVVVGAPTHAFTMSRASTRAEAGKTHGAPHVPARGIREWLDVLKSPTTTIPALVFDTRVDHPRLPGSAAKAARQGLRRVGLSTGTAQETFRVHGYGGPLLDGELERAVAWATGSLVELGLTAPRAA